MVVLDSASRHKLKALNNQKVKSYVEEAISLCKPAKVTVIDDSPLDRNMSGKCPSKTVKKTYKAAGTYGPL